MTMDVNIDYASEDEHGEESSGGSQSSDYDCASAASAGYESMALNRYQDMSFDPRLQVSDHESDDELSMVGYCSSTAMSVEGTSELCHRPSRLEQQVNNWCICENCRNMATEMESYCCRESTTISDALLSENGNQCVIELDIFKKTIEEPDVLELQAIGNRDVKRDNEGKIKAEGFRFIAYSTFLKMCSLRFIGKGRRYVIPSCVVVRIRDLYPSPDGQYTDFQCGVINSRI